MTPQEKWELLNHAVANIRGLAGELLDVGFDDYSELSLKCHGIVAECAELLRYAMRFEREAADRRDVSPREACPVVEIAEWGRR